MGVGHKVVRHIYGLDGLSSYCDLFDETNWSLYEAKGDVRESVRMAVGQLLDYRRFHTPRPRLVLLLPRQPSGDITAFLASVGIGSVFREPEMCGARARQLLLAFLLLRPV